ncbi:MAG: MFS transporter [Myxococcaceae bacterium]
MSSPLREFRDLRFFIGTRFVVTLATQIQSVAIGWQVYQLTKDPLALGYVGLAQFVPAMALALVTGHVADRIDRRRILMVCYALFAVVALTFAGMAQLLDVPLLFFYAVVVVLGIARAFVGPAGQSFIPQLVPAEHLQQSLALGSSAFQVATIVGPSVGGLILSGLSLTSVYLLCAVLYVLGIAFTRAMRPRPVTGERKSVSRSELLGGIRYVFQNRIILGAISLDLFAVLLGGAVALLPIFAQDMLKTGPWGLGVLRSAPAVGAFAMALYLARFPLKRHAGAILFGSVAVFGVATILFGLSKSLVLSVAALTVLGAADMISVVLRSTVVQLATPSEMRGRVSAVNMVFIGASNELGDFESGVTARWWGAVAAVVVGGAGTIGIVALWAWLFPDLRRIQRVEDALAEPSESKKEAGTA